MPPRPQRCRWIRTGAAILAILAGVGLALVAWANHVISQRGESTYDDASALPKRHVGLILGTSWADAKGHVNGYFVNRIDAATTLWRLGKIDVIVVSGDNGCRDYDEPTAMKDALIRNGIPAARIRCDYAGFRTLDSIIRLKAIFGQDHAIVISQRFQNERAIYIGEHHGISLLGYNAKDVDGRFGFKTNMREYAARLACLYDINIRHRGPRYYGPAIDL